MWPDAGRPQLGTPGSIVPGQGEGKEGKRARAQLSAHRPCAPSSLSLLEAGPEVEKLDLSSPGQGLLLCSQGTQCLAEPCSQELGTPSHPSSQSRLVRGSGPRWGVGVELGRP